MADLSKEISKYLDPLENRISQLVHSIETKELEISTLTYSLIGLQTTLHELTMAANLMQSTQAPIPDHPSSQQQKQKIFVPLKSSSFRDAKKIDSKSPKKVSNNFEQLPLIETIDPKYKPDKEEKILKLTPSPSMTSIRHSVVIDKSSPTPGSHKRTKSVSYLTPRRESPARGTTSPMRNSILGDEYSPMRDSMTSDMILEEVETEIPKNKNMCYTEINFAINVKRPKRVSRVHFIELLAIFSNKISIIIKMFKNIKTVDLFKISKPTKSEEPLSISKIKLEIILYSLKRRIRALRIDNDISININPKRIDFIDKISFSLDNLSIYRLALFYPSQLVFFPSTKEGSLFDLPTSLNLSNKFRELDFNIPYEDRFFFIIESLHKTFSTCNKSLAINFSFKEDAKFPAWEKITGLEWSFLSKFSTKLSIRTPEAPIIDFRVAPNLKELHLIIETGCKMDMLSGIDNFGNLQTLDLQTKLNLRGYQNFFRQCSFPIHLADLKFEFSNIPAKELFCLTKEFNPHLDKKFELHEYYGSFCKKVHRLQELRALRIIYSTKNFESWNSYIATSLLGSRTRVKYFTISASSMTGKGDEPFDLEELFNRAGSRSALREITVLSTAIEFNTARHSKVVPKLRNLNLESQAVESKCAFRIQTLLEHLPTSKINGLRIKSEVFALDAVPFINRVTEFLNLRELHLKINGENLSDEESIGILDSLSTLSKLEDFWFAIVPLSSDSKVFLSHAKQLFENHRYLKYFWMGIPESEMFLKLPERVFEIQEVKNSLMIL